MKELLKYAALAGGAAIALRQLGIWDITSLWSDAPAIPDSPAEVPAPNGSTGGGTQPISATTNPTPAPSVTTPGAAAPSGQQVQDAAAITLLVGRGVSQQLATQWVQRLLTIERLRTIAAGGNADAVRLADAAGVRLNADQWNWYRNNDGKGQITVDLIDPAMRSTTMLASEYQQRLSAAGLAGLGLLAYSRR